MQQGEPTAETPSEGPGTDETKATGPKPLPTLRELFERNLAIGIARGIVDDGAQAELIGRARADIAKVERADRRNGTAIAALARVMKVMRSLGIMGSQLQGGA